MNPTWREALRHRNFVMWLVFALFTVAMLGLFVESFFQNVILNKQGVFLHDFILEQFTPTDWSFEIMAVLYSAMVISVFFNYSKPWIVLYALATFAIVTWLRMCCIYFFTLEAPEGVIPLTDPFLATVVYDRSDFVKDLFFSGHMTTISVLFVVEQNIRLKWLMGILSVGLAILILSQHVHYTIDVLFAPIITFIVYFFLRKFIIRVPVA